MQTLAWSKATAAKAICLVVILLLSVQYLFNVVVYNRYHSTFISYAVENSNRSIDFLRNFMAQTTEQPMELCPLIPPDISM